MCFGKGKLGRVGTHILNLIVLERNVILCILKGISPGGGDGGGGGGAYNRSCFISYLTFQINPTAVTIYFECFI